MKRRGTRLLNLLLAFALIAPIPAVATAAEPASIHPSASVSFLFQPRDSNAKPYQFLLHAGGDGTYSESGEAAGPARLIHAGPIVMHRLMGGLSRVKSGKCEARAKNIAQTGVRTLTYVEPAGTFTCSFNYSDDSRLMDAVEGFEALAETLQYGDRLAHDFRFDRLGLDADMDQFVSEIAAGRAIEPENVAPVLRELVASDEVIERVRRKAQRMLNQSEDASAEAARPR